MMTINFHGVRGSHPVADSNMVKYGGNTACVEIVKANKKGIMTPVIIDGGSGLIKYGYYLLEKQFAGEYSKTFSVFFTHLHPDHIEGFNFFAPIYVGGCSMHIMGMAAPQWDTEAVLRNRMAAPAFPIEYRDLKSSRLYRTLLDGDTVFIDQNGEPQKKADKPLFEVRVMQAYAPSHPQQGALYYLVIDPDDGSSVACVWDIESHIGGDVRVINFIRGAHVLIHDTQYTDEEYANEKIPVQGFGHSTYSMAVENAGMAGVKNLIGFHYNPRHSDRVLESIEKKYSGKYPFAFYMSDEG
jgi:ribonuclease BN (tRNA processing enzyme)